MARYDSGVRYDSGARYDEPDPPAPNPLPKKRKSMKHSNYYPVRIGNQIVWLQNFKTKLPTHATTLGLVPADVTAILLDVDNAVYALEKYRGAVAAFADGAYQRIDDVLLAIEREETISWLTFTLPTAPALVDYGALRRILNYVNDVITEADAYDSAIGQDLGTEGPETGAPNPATTAPDFSLRPTGGGKVEVVWTKGIFDGIKLEFDLGAAGLKPDLDLRPNYTLNWLPAPGTSAIIKVRLHYIYKGEDFGNWSPWQTWTLMGV